MNPRMIALLVNHGALLLLVLLIVIGSLVSNVFLAPQNFINILRASTIIGIVALGQTLLIITRNFDMSVGSVVALAGTVAVIAQPLGLMPSLLLALMSGMLVGLANGLIVVTTRANPFLVTLGMQLVIYGLTLTITRARTLYGEIDAFNLLGRGLVFDMVPVSVIIFLVLAILFSLVLRFTVYGRLLYAIGGNERSCRLAGIATDRLKVVTFVICGMTAALAGLIITSRLNSTTANVGFGMDFDSIIAVVIGGTALFGSAGGAMRTVYGVLILGVLLNLMTLLTVPFEGQLVAKALLFIMVVAVTTLFDSWRRGTR